MHQKGFTLIELILVIAIMTIVAGATLPLSYKFLTQNDLELATQKIVQSIRRAEFLAASGNSDSTWGVHVATTDVTLFNGTGYLARDLSKDEKLSFDNVVTLGGTTDFVFQKLSGYPISSGTITLTSQDNVVKTIIINNRGLIEY
jgi:prepilin-type N-terminal cleavage/methylation domain-containing protein